LDRKRKKKRKETKENKQKKTNKKLMSKLESYTKKYLSSQTIIKHLFQTT